MSNVVIQLKKNDLSAVKDHYAASIVNKPKNAVFLAKVNGTTITAYASGKVMFQGQNAQMEANKWMEQAATPVAKKKPSVNDHQFSPPGNLFTSSHIGTDEAGTGDYFGPITVSAVFVPEEKIDILKKMGITDSKALTDERIRSLAQELVKAKIPYTLLTMDNAKYNRLQNKGWNQGKMKAMMHHHAIEKITAKIGAEQPVLIDQFCQPAVYMKYIGTERKKLHSDTYFMTKAESHSISVAAASIIARAKFVKEMDVLSARFGITIPKGASAKVDETAAYLIKKNGIEALQDAAKMHFANTDKAMKYVK
ncbi:ribonuclease HIII [Gracilibacillus ureilyticus]|uniref:Ribonuclease HIII n=1 Tax=Gracilibacillus ureilyticus TaxID=531814 RepID=A0A1H9UG03_9BACI|nr:ribonuclease HIII [Gracilibacillus ureilyticus]SES08292.1 ribonuclease HIII [Gracilibacillus ureilyticus]